MAKKLTKNTFPAGTGPDDFKCDGPVATQDTIFNEAKIADFGCFNQDGSDSNKMYHVCMCTHKTTKVWYVYVAYGREGAPNLQYQWFECANEADARRVFQERCAEKNTKRGKWATVAGKKLYVPKDGKDLYRVRKLANRSFGLTDAKSITNDPIVAKITIKKTKKGAGKTGYRCDPQTTQLLRDLTGAAVTYTRTTLQGGTTPTQAAIDEARDLLEASKKRVATIGSDLDTQVADKELRTITYALYSRVPKIKPLRAPEKTWILSQDNIKAWEDDLLIYESTINSGTVEEIAINDPMANMPVDMEWVDPQTDFGKWIVNWYVTMTKNSHGHGRLQVHNVWKINRHGDDEIFAASLAETEKEMPSNWNNERPLFAANQKERPDIQNSRKGLYWRTNTNLLFHGTKSLCVAPILKSNFRFPHEIVGVSINGSALGAAGTYFADDRCKSAGYCSTSDGKSQWVGTEGHVAGRRSFMFACDVILGHPHVADDCIGFPGPPNGHHSIFGKGGHTKTTWWAGGRLINNEWVVYRKGRNLIKYLAEISW